MKIPVSCLKIKCANSHPPPQFLLFGVVYAKRLSMVYLKAPTYNMMLNWPHVQFTVLTFQASILLNHNTTIFEHNCKKPLLYSEGQGAQCQATDLIIHHWLAWID